MQRAILAVLVASALVPAAGCATESHRPLEPASVESRGTPFAGEKEVLGVAGFHNRSGYMTGVFSDGVDRLGNQARVLLRTHLSQSGRFSVLDRDDEEALAAEAAAGGSDRVSLGAAYVVVGEVTSFGRRETGDHILFGLAGRGKSQVAYARVSLNVVDVRTSEVVHAVQGAGEYELGDREFLGTGGSSGYDATLGGKVLDLAVREAVNRLVEGREKGEWGGARP